MINDWLIILACLAGIFVLIFASSYIQTTFKISPEFTRKLVHVLTAIFTFISPWILTSKYPPIFLAVVFIFINGLAIMFTWFKGIHGTGRVSLGTIYFPMAYGILCYFFWDHQPEIMQISMLVLGFGDSVAALVGESTDDRRVYTFHKSEKSLEGSSAMFLVSFLVIAISGVFLLPGLYLPELMMLSVLVAFFATLVESLFDGGSDNLAIPLISALFLDYILQNSNVVLILWMITIVAMVACFLFYKLKFLNLSGSIAAFIMAVILLGMGGWDWTMPILLFFVFSSIISLTRKKIQTGSIEKASQRDAIQVAANGGIPVIILILSLNNLWPWSYIIFLTAIAAATADTWSTEFGRILGSSRPFDPFRFKKVDKGISGGMSIPGTVGGLLGALMIAFFIFFQTDYYFEKINDGFILIVISGFLGMVVDSFIGSYFQVKYQCHLCGNITERKEHCSMESQYDRGVRWINNDMVNVLSIIISCILSILGYHFFIK